MIAVNKQDEFDTKILENSLKKYMREQGVSLLVAHQHFISILGDASDAVREEYLKNNNTTIKELA